MTINFFESTDPKNKIGKTLASQGVYTGSLRNVCSILSPIVTIEAESISGNYMQIEEFGRYYFITDIKSIRTGMWEVSGRVDVLESFSAGIKALPVILADTQQTGMDSYINNDVYATKVKRKTDIVNFPSGLLSDGEFILITAGGVGV